MSLEALRGRRAAALARPATATPLYTLLRVAAFIAGMGLAIGSGSRGQVLAADTVVVAGGRILNPKTARSQVLGSVVWGIGMALP